MIADELTYQILQAFGFAPTAEQAAAIGTFCRFLIDRDDRVAMILRGSAGTGKTTLAGAMVKALAGLHQRMVLLAPYWPRGQGVFDRGGPCRIHHSPQHLPAEVDGRGGRGFRP